MDPIFPVSSQLLSVLTWAAVVALAMLAMVIFLELMLWRRLFKIVESLKYLRHPEVRAGEPITPAHFRHILDASIEIPKSFDAMSGPFLPGGNRNCILCGTTGLKSPINGKDDEIRSLLCPNCLHEYKINDDKSVVVNKTQAEVAKSVYGVE